MRTFFRIAGWVCLIIAAVCILMGLPDFPRKFGVAVLSMGFWGTLGLVLLFFTGQRKYP
jgi:hypothetical protein